MSDMPSLSEQNFVSTIHPHGAPDPEWITPNGSCALCARLYADGLERQCDRLAAINAELLEALRGLFAACEHIDMYEWAKEMKAARSAIMKANLSDTLKQAESIADFRLKEMARLMSLNAELEKLVQDCQNDLAAWIVPDSGISDHDVLSTLLGRLDGPQARAAIKKATD